MKIVLTILFFPAILLYYVTVYFSVPFAILNSIGEWAWVALTLVCYPLAAYLGYIGIRDHFRNKAVNK